MITVPADGDPERRHEAGTHSWVPASCILQCVFYPVGVTVISNLAKRDTPVATARREQVATAISLDRKAVETGVDSDSAIVSWPFGRCG